MITGRWTVSRILEVEADVFGDPTMLRIEILTDLVHPGVFKARLWRLDSYRLTPSSEAEEEDADEEVVVEWSWFLSDGLEHFESDSVENAMETVLAKLERRLAKR